MSGKSIVICKSCDEETDQDDMTIFEGNSVCEGCAENAYFFSDPNNDITGRNFSDDCEY